ncbi:MAG: Y-family DNA polymerase [Candidatus Cloacimonadota bacterium]|nr:Y-family DNA polymerase [Candidatus Cloacimonadota bacterium]
MSKIFALVDCNSFYVSCERVFRPDLLNKPVGVLSNNDGCIVALSNELKQLGVTRGVPEFKIRHLIKKHNITLFSSNYALYGDMSARVMKSLEKFTSDLEIYSIDEAFLDLSDFNGYNLEEYGKKIKYAIEKWTGIPVSVGIASTKTLAKLANHIAKKYTKFDGVFNLVNHPKFNEVLKTVAVEKIWGVGRKNSEKLHKNGYHTALDLITANEWWMKSAFTIVGLKTLRELKGIPQSNLTSEIPNRKSIVSSRSFGQPVEDFENMRQSIIFHTTIAVRKLRKQNLVASSIMVFISTNPYKNEPQYTNYQSEKIAIPSAFTPDFIYIATKLLSSIYCDHYKYKKAGVMISNIISEIDSPIELFSDAYADGSKKIIMQTIDLINNKFGKNTIHFGLSQKNQNWKMKSQKLSPKYTTDINEIAVVKT